MTTFALVAGMVPVAMGAGEGGDFRAPLGVSVIGGVLTSTLLTLLVIPTVYETLADARDWVGAKFGKPSAEHGEPGGHSAPHARPVAPEA
jgi:HAE1 family hydrophobic/amphiphilic exporter-1